MFYESHSGFSCQVSTFGFGYNLDSDMLVSISQAGGGNFSFISDAPMIGNVFMRALANVLSTHTQASVISYFISFAISCAISPAAAEGPAARYSHQRHHHMRPCTCCISHAGHAVGHRRRPRTPASRAIPRSGAAYEACARRRASVSFSHAGVGR
jgi:hypothetical protein